LPLSNACTACTSQANPFHHFKKDNEQIGLHPNMR